MDAEGPRKAPRRGVVERPLFDAAQLHLLVARFFEPGGAPAAARGPGAFVGAPADPRTTRPRKRAHGETETGDGE